MSKLEEVKNKVQRILTDELNRVEIDRDGDYVIRHESSVSFVHLYEMNSEQEDTDIVISVYSPLVTAVPLTPELYKWVATEGQAFAFGGCYVNPDEDGKTGWIYYRISIVGNDLDPNELKGAVYRTMFTSNDLDDVVKGKFGGKLFTED